MRLLLEHTLVDREGGRHARPGARRDLGVPVDERLPCSPTLRAAIADDRAAGRLPVAVVATVEPTSSTSIDPVDAIADVCGEAGVWLHVDAAYAGVMAILPEYGTCSRAPRADSLVVNPHNGCSRPSI